DPWLPLPPESDTRNDEAAHADPDSIVHLYRSLLALRAERTVLRDGTCEVLDAPDGVVAFRRRAEGAASVTVVVSMSDEPVEVGAVVGDAATVLVDSSAVLAPGS